MKYLLILSLLFVSNAYASWEGYDDNKHEVEIDEDSIEEGDDIEVYDRTERKYKNNITVESITHYGDTLEIEVFDYDIGKYVTYELEED